jgi:ankyrin repeat protein
VYKPRRKPRKVSGIHGIIHQASSVDNSNCLRLLLTLGVSANDLCNEVDKALPLHFAVIANCQSNVKLLMENGAKPNSQDCVGNTGLHLAVMQENLEMVALLESFGADATLENQHGESAIKSSRGEIRQFFQSLDKYKSVTF